MTVVATPSGRLTPRPARARWWAALVVIAVTTGAAAMAAGGRGDRLLDGFRSPPPETAPWCYWYWISDNISTQGTTRDLEAMRRVGIGAALIGNIFLEDQKPGDVKVLSEPWWQAVEHAIREGGRVGVDIGLFNCPGWSQSGGPWISPTQAMRRVAMSEARLRGGEPAAVPLPAPAQPFQDLCVLAFPAPAAEGDTLALRDLRFAVEPAVPGIERMFDGRTTTSVALPPPVSRIEIEIERPFTARSLTVHPAAAFVADAELSARDANGGWTTVRRFEIDRRKLSRQVGFLPMGPVAIALSPVTARQFRLTFTAKSGTAVVSEVEVAASPRLERYVEKQLGKMFQEPLPPWDYYRWAPQPEPAETAFAIDPNRVLDVSDRLGADGWLRWTPPDGDWIVLRAGLTPTGVSNAPASPEGVGLEVDKMSRRWTEHHFESFVGRLVSRMPPSERRALKYVVADSYETGSQNWTDDFRERFRRRCGYDPYRFLPVLTGRLVESADQSDRFLWDLRRLVADLIATEYVGGLRAMCERHGLRLWLENYGHWGFPGEFLKYGGQSHDLGGEFWSTGSLGSIELRAAASAAHIYGRRRVSAEAFTSVLRFESTPWSIKARGDWALTHGINHWVLHVYIHQPWDDRRPGVNAWFSTEFNRHNTWFEQGREWIDYYRRCHFLLQQGRHVADIAYFIGEDAPIMTGGRVPERPDGYDFDYVNAEVLLRDMTVRNGRWTLPSGPSYAMLVLPPSDSMRPAILERLRDLVRAGGALYGPRPTRSPSAARGQGDAETRRVADDLWGTAAGTGRLFDRGPLGAALAAAGAGPDVTDAAGLLWAHRSSPDADIYFLSNQTDASVRAAPKFRDGLRRRPELWDPAAGRVAEAPVFEAERDGVRVAVEIEPRGSVFVVFRGASMGEAPRLVGVERNGAALLSTTPPALASPTGIEPGIVTNTFAFAAWVSPSGSIDLPKETATGVHLAAQRNEVVTPQHGHSIVPGHPSNAGAGLSVGVNGAVVFEHGANYFAPVLVHAASITGWTHVAVVYHDRQPELYLNGRRVRVGLTGAPAVHPSLSAPTRPPAEYRGLAGPVLVWDRALSPAEVAEWAAAGPPAEPGPGGPMEIRRVAGQWRAAVPREGRYRWAWSNGATTECAVASLPEGLAVRGPWRVELPADMDLPPSIALPELQPLNEHESEAVRHLAGTVVYRTDFEWNGAATDGVDWSLDLGGVEAIAEVRLNGRPLGVLWKPPFRLDATPALRPGPNRLEVAVTGTWRNRLIGEERFPNGWPGAPMPPRFKPFLTTPVKFGSQAKLSTFGLLGPVRLAPRRWMDVPAPDHAAGSR